LVEDNPEAAWLVQSSLEDHEGETFRVEWTSNLLEAMTRLASPGVEVILLDLGMPELDGYRSFRAIETATRGKVPIVILTADDSQYLQGFNRRMRRLRLPGQGPDVHSATATVPPQRSRVDIPTCNLKWVITGPGSGFNCFE
jgi:CheY-like chemotaxis protein